MGEDSTAFCALLISKHHHIFYMHMVIRSTTVPADRKEPLYNGTYNMDIL